MDIKSEQIEPLDPRSVKLFEAGIPVFVRYGYRKTTVEEICRAAGMSKRTFYELFKDKADFFARAVFRSNEILIYEWLDNLSEGLNAIAKIEYFIEFYTRSLIKQPINRVLISEPETMGAMGSLGHDIMVSPITAIMAQFIEQGKAEKVFREQDTEIAVLMVFSLLDSMYWLGPAIFGFEFADDKSILDSEIRAFVLRGLGVVR